MPTAPMTDQDIAALVVQLRGFATKLGLDQDQVRRIVAAIDVEVRESGRLLDDDRRLAEVRRRMVVAAGG